MSNPTPPSVVLSLTFKRASKALDFYAEAFGAVELYRMGTPDGGVPHGEFRIGNTNIYCSDEDPAWGAKAMPEGVHASCLFTIMVEDCDAAYQRALGAGVTSISPPKTHFWGQRSCVVADPFGYRWSLNQHVEDVSPEELERRARELMAGDGGA